MNQSRQPVLDLAPGLVPSADSRTWAALAHLLSAVCSWLTLGLGAWLVPLVILYVKRPDPFVTAHAREALNLRLVLALLVAFILVVLPRLFHVEPQHREATLPLFIVLVYVIVHVLLPVWTFLSAVDLAIASFVASRAFSGKPYRYPLVPRLLGRTLADSAAA